MAHEVVYDLARQAATAEIPVGLTEDVLDAAAKGGLGFLTQEQAQFPATFDASVRGLEDSEFDAFVLTDLRGLSNREAADVLGTSHTTITRRRESARLALREEIAA